MNRFWFVPLIVILGAFVGLTWFNFKYSSQNPGGNDFLVHWVGARALLIDGLSPYSDEVALRIQTLAYGRAATAGEHELRVAYPLYSELIFAPFALINDYNLARAVWMTILEIALIALAFLSLRITGWHPSIWLLPFYLLFAVLWYHGLRPLINGNAVILIALLLAGVLVSLQAGRDELAGILLAFSTIKPQVIILFLAFVFIWAASQRRWKVILWTMITLIILTVIGMFFIPDWPLQNIREILRYPGYNPPGTPAAVFTTWLPASGAKIGLGLTIILSILLLSEWLLARRKDFRWFLWTACLTLVVSQWIGIQTDPGNFVVLFIPLTLVFAVWMERWGRAGWPGIVFSMVLLFFGLWVIFIKTIQTTTGQPLQSPIMFFPLPLFVLIGLYWVRWWAVRPPRLLMENLRIRD